MTRRLRTSLLTGIAALTLLDARVVWADGIHFIAGTEYDNTPNVVTAGPTFTNNQTTGVFRDVFWWRNTADNPPNNPSAPFIHNPPTSISPDYINAGQNLVLGCGISACDNGTGTQTALNFTGPNQSGGVSYLSIYDTTPLQGNTTTDTVFDASGPGGLTIYADVLFAGDRHGTGGGVVALYNEGQDALALVLNNAGNTETSSLELVFRSPGQGQQLISSAEITPGDVVLVDNWYRVTLNVLVNQALNTYTATGTIQNHVLGTNPHSGLLATLATINTGGSLLSPGTGIFDPFNLTNPGEIGVIAVANGAINDVGCAPLAANGTYNGNSNPVLDGCQDNVGVSITNFNFPGGTPNQQVVPVPEPGSMFLLGSGLLGLGKIYQRRKRRDASSR